MAWRLSPVVPKNGKNGKQVKVGVLFDVEEYLANAGASRRLAKYKKGQAIFSQDDPCNEVWYIQSGNAKLTIVNPQGKEAVLAILGPGDFLGEGCIIGNPVRMSTATALIPLGPTVRDVACPFCGSSNTSTESEFGATSCKSLHVCHACHQPFEHFKTF